MEIIVADNNSACGIDAVIATAAGCRVVHGTHAGGGPGAQRGGCSGARRDPRVHRQRLRARNRTGSRTECARSRNTTLPEGMCVTTARDPLRPTPVEAWEIVFGFDFERYILLEGYTGSGNMWVWRKVFDAVGGFRAGVAEDMDWSFRATAAGFRLGYERRAVVSHLARSDWSELLKRWRRVLAEHYLLTREKPFGTLRWAAWTAGMPLSIAPHSIKVLRSERLLSPREKASAMAVLVAHRLWRTYYMARLMVVPPPRNA